ncbi:MAG: YebC/PmpR family DNA-binding transcriptional regulator, partial [Armatimonadetes bacterium]|nr:YebC/PmpR family DNA-binding transcriptional regulator [Armatimonadota bacterium]
FALKNAIAKAREVNMPADNIKRVIEKGTGADGGVQYEEITYEGYGPHGVAVMVEAATDNRNRTAADMRHVFSKYGGNLGENGCVSWLFQKRGIITFAGDSVGEETLLDLAISAGADDVRDAEGTWEVETSPDDYFTVLEALEKAGLKAESSLLTMIPSTTVKLGRSEAPAVLKLMDMLEDNDDVQNVYANFDIPSEVLEEVTA